MPLAGERVVALMVAGAIATAVVQTRAQDGPMRQAGLPGPEKTAGASAASGPTNVAEKTEGEALEEIVVTAQRRLQNAETVPIAVSTLSGEDLKNLKIDTTAGLSQFVPSLHIFAEDIGSEYYTIRGIGRAADDLSVDPGVAVFLNDGYLPRPGEANMGLFDVDRVEVLKGPQGTLYGKNATAGAINIITRGPTDSRSGYISSEIGRYGRMNFSGAVGDTLIDQRLSGRLAFKSDNRDGIYSNLTTGDKANDIDSRGLRGSLRYLPSGKWTVNFIADWEKTDQQGVLKSVISDSPGIPYEFFLHGPDGNVRPGITLPTQESDRLTARSAINGKEGLETYGAQVNQRYDAGSFDLVSITNYRGEKSYTLEDIGRAQEVTAYQASNEDTWSASQEFRLVSNAPNQPGGENHLSWTAGSYFYFEQGSRTPGYYWSVVPFSSITTFRQSIRTNAVGLFGETRYRIFDRVGLTGGLRLTSEEKKFSVDAASVPIPGVAGATADSPYLDNGNFADHESKRWNKLSPKVVLDYQAADDVFAYASFSQGFKSGGFSGQPSSPPAAVFNPESVSNYEIGFKGEFLQRTLRFNADVFYSVYSNLQLQGFNASGLPTTQTADARSRGVELDATAKLTSAFLLRAGVSLTDPTYKHYISQLPGFSDAAHTYDMSGKRIALVPANTASGLANYHLHTTGSGDYDFQIDGVYASKVTTEFGSTLWAPAYTKGDVRVIWSPGSSVHWRLTAYVNNFTDKFYYTGGGPVSKYNTDKVRLGLVEDPRTFGLILHYEF